MLVVELDEGRSQLVCLKRSRTSRRSDGVAKIEEGNTNYGYSVEKYGNGRAEFVLGKKYHEFSR